MDKNNNKSLKPASTIMSTIFTFGASLLLLQGAAHASNNQVNTQNNHQAVIKNNDNLANNNNDSSTSANTQTSTIQQNNNSQAAPASSAASTDSEATTTFNVASASQQAVSSAQMQVSSASVSAAPAARQAVLAASLVQTSSSNNSGLRNMTPYRQAFLDSIKQGALDGWNQYGVLPSVTAAQAILESAWGQSALATEGHNLFGIKGSYNGQSIYMNTREVGAGGSYYVNAAFRRYPNNAASVKDHGAFLANNSRYHNLLWQTDYHTVTRLIRQDGYATDPNYTYALNNLIQTYGLDSWDQEVMNVNTGWIDNVYVDHAGNMHVTGWHASTNYNSSMHHFIILVDANSGQELVRKEVSGVYRQDVKNKYSTSRGISGWGGFDFSIPYTSNLAGHSFKVVSRYTYDVHGDPNGGDTWYSDPVSASANEATLDNFSIKNGKLNVRGWNDNDLSIKESNHYIILWDATKHSEIARKKVDVVDSPDVANSYAGNIYGSNKCRFEVNFDLTPAMLNGDKIEIISRYSDDAVHGEGNRSDYWFSNNLKSFSDNQGWLDNFDIQNGKLHVRGWQAADASLAEPYHYIIVYDATKGCEIERRLVNTTDSKDVANAHPDIANAGKSRFDVDFDLTPAMVNGDQIEIISRYSDSKDGEGNRTDYWFSNKKQAFNHNAAWMDDFNVQNNPIDSSAVANEDGEMNIVATGWHADDQSVQYPHHYVILYDDTLGYEVARKEVPTFTSPDVEKAHSNIANAGDSRFTTNFKVLKSLKGHKFQIISRYTSSNDGNSNYSDYWYAPKILN